MTTPHDPAFARRNANAAQQGRTYLLLDQVAHSLDNLTDKVDKLDDKMDRIQEGRAVDNQRISDHAQRITTVESKMDAMQATFYGAQVADVRQLGQVQLGAQQQFGQAQLGAQTSIGKVSQTMNETVIRIMSVALGAVGTGFISLLVYALQHAK